MDEQPQLRDHPVMNAGPRRRQGWSRLAWLAVGVAALLLAPTLYLGLSAGDRLPQLLQFGWWGTFSPLLGIEFGIVGALILQRHPSHPVGRLAVVGGICTSLSAAAGAYAAYSYSHGLVLPETGFAVWLRAWIWYPSLSLLFVVVPALFPDGNLPWRRWRPVLWTLVLGGTASQLIWVSITEVLFGFPLADGPWPVGGWFFSALVTLGGVCQLVSLFIAAVSVLVRFRRSTGVPRLQLKWFLAAVGFQAALWAASLALSAQTHLAPYQNPYFELLIPLAQAAMPLAIGIAILRHRLYDIDIVISRGLAYAGLAAFITGAYLLVVAGIGLLLGTGGRPNLPLSVLAMGLVVVLLHPVQARLQRLANRLVYGTPADPYAILTELSRTPATGDLGHALAQIAEAVARGMGSQPARIRLLLSDGGTQAAAWPPESTGPFGQSFKVTHGSETVAEIEVEGSGDRGLTEALTGQAGLALRTLRLSADLAVRLRQLEEQAAELAASRTRLVQAQEAERRHLERDLHDGIQQDLVVLVAKARLARNQLARDPSLAAATLADLQSSAQQAIADLRSLTRGIHPAILSSRGLVEAIDSMAARMPVGVRVDADPTLREVRYAPEIEGAAYFVVAEGLANVLKHAGATEASVTIRAGGSCLRLAIADDGHGFDLKATQESGLRGLRDRVAALGGKVELVSGRSGTSLAVSLPTGGETHV
jgi:signal transduction histidine kinase